MSRSSTAGRSAACAAFTLGCLLAAASDAALTRYDVNNLQILHAGDATPQVTFFTPADDPPSKAILDESADPPVMVKLEITGDGTQTVVLPGLSGFLFASRKSSGGPAPDQTAVSGSSASQIRWGTVTGWEISGRNWCNSEPASICLIAGDTEEETGPTSNVSPFYDIGTWIFHGTGFTSIPFVYSRITTGAPGDNRMYTLMGGLDPNGTVPVLPLAALALLGSGIAAAGVLALRRRRR